MKCKFCPLDSNIICYGENGRLPHFCNLAETGNKLYLKMIVDRAKFEIDSIRENTEESNNSHVNTRLKLPTPSQKDYVKTCLYRDCNSSCSSSTCYAGIRGYHPEGSPSIVTYVTIYDCIDCLKNINTNKSKNIMIDENQKS